MASKYLVKVPARKKIFIWLEQVYDVAEALRSLACWRMKRKPVLKFTGPYSHSAAAGWALKHSSLVTGIFVFDAGKSHWRVAYKTRGIFGFVQGRTHGQSLYSPNRIL